MHVHCTCILHFIQIARVMGNALLNEVLEANLTPDSKPPPDADMLVMDGMEGWMEGGRDGGMD